jgi:hypothetical protein
MAHVRSVPERPAELREPGWRSARVASVVPHAERHEPALGGRRRVMSTRSDDPLDRSNGWEAAAQGFIADRDRSRIGVAVIETWCRAAGGRRGTRSRRGSRRPVLAGAPRPRALCARDRRSAVADQCVQRAVSCGPGSMRTGGGLAILQAHVRRCSGMGPRVPASRSAAAMPHPARCARAGPGGPVLVHRAAAGVHMARPHDRPASCRSASVRIAQSSLGPG